jgi:hypothetical protein
VNEDEHALLKMKRHDLVTLAKAGVQGMGNSSVFLDSGWSLPRKVVIRGRNDESMDIAHAIHQRRKDDQ